jgi:hypothetical protein
MYIKPEVITTSEAISYYVETSWLKIKFPNTTLLQFTANVGYEFD